MAENLPIIANPIQTPAPIFYSPASIVAILNAGIAIKEEKKVIQMRGIFKKEGKQNYGGSYYNRLKMKLPTIK